MVGLGDLAVLKAGVGNADVCRTRSSKASSTSKCFCLHPYSSRLCVSTGKVTQQLVPVIGLALRVNPI